MNFLHHLLTNTLTRSNCSSASSLNFLPIRNHEYVHFNSQSRKYRFARAGKITNTRKCSFYRPNCPLVRHRGKSFRRVHRQNSKMQIRNKIISHGNYQTSDNIVAAYWQADLNFIITSVKAIELPSMFDHVEGCAPDILCTRISHTHTHTHTHIHTHALWVHFSRSGWVREWVHRCILCGSCRRWGIQALSVVNTRVIIVAGHLDPQTRHIRSLTIQSLRSKLRLINNSETMREIISRLRWKVQLERWALRDCVNSAVSISRTFRSFPWTLAILITMIG